MAYRTYINRNEWLGNHECPKVIIDELKRQGCNFNEDYCVHGFEIKDLDGLVKATEKYILEMFEHNNDIANFSNTIKRSNNLTQSLSYSQNCAYIFASANLLKFVGENNYEIDFDYDKKSKQDKFVYKLKENVKCIFDAY